jgi:prophage regulatory protein
MLEKFLRLPEVCQTTGLSRASIYAYMKLDKFPKPVRIGAASVAWPQSSIAKWQESCIAASQH